jgi:hypothetical protein
VTITTIVVICLDDQAQGRILVSEAIISAKVRSLEEKKEGCCSTDVGSVLH